ncbi:hypothetical protein [Sphingobium subterraneum]|uniref:Lipoprotein n=1 Tax=Sphingobium subterraneum TaxID=627688 RepID=A0A841J2F6_9SPHN|nr:hypothetical protein [Sphingobium subterraneum]MBB6124894.1 hypothetical protein [Sphingobium subterraneum]
MKDISGDKGKLHQSGIMVLSIALIALSTAGCQGGTEPTSNNSATVETPNTQAPQPLPVAAIEPVGRAELLAAAAVAADEVAAGNALPKANRELVDRTFELRLPFGCGEGMLADWGEWSIDPKTRVLRINARPQVLGDDPTIKTLAAGVIYDAAEGFWIDRPWTRSENCPASLSSETAPASPVGEATPVAAPDISPMHTFALVQYFSPDAPRTLRRGSRPYSYTGKVPETETVGAKGFHLKLIGRIRAYGDGQPIHCVVTTHSGPPVCAAAVEFTQVVLEDADTGDSLAEWNK